MFGVNTYVVWDPVSLQAAIVDPGMLIESDVKQICDFISQNDFIVKYLINTHMHIDHVMGDAIISKTYNVSVSGHSNDSYLAERVAQQARDFGLVGLNVNNVKIDHAIFDGEKLWLGKEYLQVIEVPGHSKGSVALYCPQGKFVITGDALFQGSIGRTDLPGGNHMELLNSIRTRLLTLPMDTKVYPGHGPATTIGYECEFNPFL